MCVITLIGPILQPGEDPCPIDPWIVVPDKSKYVDQQTLKLQENPEVSAHLVKRGLIFIHVFIKFAFSY